MFSIQRKFFEATHPCTREEFYEVVSSPETAAAIAKCRELYAAGDRRGYDACKRSLPLFIFMSEIMPNEVPDGKGRPRPLDRWRAMEAARLNGLVMADFDLKENPSMADPAAYWQQFVAEHSHWLDPLSHDSTIYLAHVTPSGHGLRVVFAASKQTGNLFDNVQKMGTVLGLTPDKSCKDASRGSFACRKEDILFINEDIFNYENEEYDKAFGDFYRCAGGTKPHRLSDSAVRRSDNPQPPVAADARQAAADKPEEAKPLAYKGVPMERIAQAWAIENPVRETRHGNMLEAASDLRYIVESPEELVRALMEVPAVKEIEKERGIREIEDAAATAWSGPRYKRIPRRMEKTLLRAGIAMSGKNSDGQDAEGEQAELKVQTSALETFSKRLQSVLAPPYDVVCEGLDAPNFLPAVFTSGTMFCTLLTRCSYTHYDGQETRLNPQSLVIAPPASGKSFVDKLDKQIMAVLRAQDSVARNALKEYKRKRKERSTSSKEQRQSALVEPQGMIRKLLSNTSNNQFYKRLVNAKEEVNGELMNLHLYMFDSELSSANKANGGADWIGKRDMELKAFSNEEAGSDYANDDSVNDFVPVLWNQVVTGTKVALAKKFNMSNINDGLCTRVAICPMQPNRYKMIAKGNAEFNFERESKLKEWGFWFDRQRGHLNISRLVDYCYELCEASAAEAEMSSDLVLDTLRRRAVYYAEWFTIPRIVARLRNEDGSQKDIKEITVTDDDLKWASIIFDAVIYWQDYFFGQMLSDSWENAKHEFVPRIRKTNSSELYDKLPKSFEISQAYKLFAGRSEASVRTMLTRWIQSNYLSRETRGRYKKLVTNII